MTVSLATTKQLFALSMNLCSFYDSETRETCERIIATPSGKTVNADICHIRGARPNSARHDSTMTDDERDQFHNLILLCPSHHRFIDSVEAHRFTVEVLMDMKERSLRSADPNVIWADDALIEWAAKSLIAISEQLLSADPIPEIPKTHPTTLTASFGASFKSEISRANDDQTNLAEGENLNELDHETSATSEDYPPRSASDALFVSDAVSRGYQPRGAFDESVNEDSASARFEPDGPTDESI